MLDAEQDGGSEEQSGVVEHAIVETDSSRNAKGERRPVLASFESRVKAHSDTTPHVAARFALWSEPPVITSIGLVAASAAATTPARPSNERPSVFPAGRPAYSEARSPVKKTVVPRQTADTIHGQWTIVPSRSTAGCAQKYCAVHFPSTATTNGCTNAVEPGGTGIEKLPRRNSQD